MAEKDQKPKAPNPIQVQKYLKGVDYPVDKQGLLEKAREEGADENVMNLLNQLPDKSYNSPKDVSRAIGEIE